MIDLKNKTVDLNIFGGQYPITKMNDEVILATRMDERNKPAETIGIDRVNAVVIIFKGICAETGMPTSFCAALYTCIVQKRQF